MPLSKARDRERKRLARLEKRVIKPSVQPEYTVVEGEIEYEGGWRDVEIGDSHWLDADGNTVYDD